MKQRIVSLIKKTTKSTIPFDVFVSRKREFGDYSTNLAFNLAKLRKKDPQGISENLAKKLSRISAFERVEAKSGFINFWIKKEWLLKEIQKILTKKNDYGRGFKKKKKIQIEFISANPTGQLTVGNGRGTFFGDSLSRILKFLGYQVTKEYYINNAKNSSQIEELGKTALKKGKVYLNDYLRKKIALIEPKLTKIIRSSTNKYQQAGYILAQEIQKDNQDFIQHKLKIKFDNWFSEQSLYEKNMAKKLLKQLQQKNLVYLKNKALWFKAKKFGDEQDRVLIRANQKPTYFFSDLMYHLDKFKRRKFDQVIDIWGADHFGYKKRLLAGLSALGISPSKLKIIIMQMLTLRRGKKKVRISKRKGEYLTLEQVVDEVGLDPTRFLFLMVAPETHLDFDLELAKKRSMENPVYYVQYTRVRVNSILNKAKTLEYKIKTSDLKLLGTEPDLRLIKELVQFPDKVKESAEVYNPQVLVTYSLNLARVFHNFYERQRVITENQAETKARLSLILTTKIVLDNLFDLIGIAKLDRM